MMVLTPFAFEIHHAVSSCGCTHSLQHTGACGTQRFICILPVQIGLERSRLLELEEKANGLQGKIGTQRKAMGGVNAAREANIQVVHTSCLVVFA